MQKRNLAIRNQVGSWGNKRWSSGLTPPSSIKHASQSHFTPQHLPAVPERYTYSSLSKMFMERNYQQEKTNSLARYCPLWDNYFCGKHWQRGWCLAWTWSVWEGWEVPLYKNPRAGRLCHLGACLSDSAERYGDSEISEIKGKWEEVSFSQRGTQSLLGSQAKRHKTKRNHWRKPPPPPTLSQLLPRRVLVIRCHRHRIEDMQAF